MSEMDNRQKAFETKYALDQELMFRIEARACKLFGLWIAEQLGLSGDAAAQFAGEVVGSNLDEPGFGDVKRFIQPKLAEKSVDLSEHVIDTKLEQFMEQARLQIMEETNK